MPQEISLITLLTVCIFLTSCSKDEKPEQITNQQKAVSPDTIKTENVFVYRCGNYSMQFTAYVQEEETQLYLPDTTVTVEHVRSASRAKYQNGEYMYWSKGDEALLETGNKTYKSCKSIPQERSWQAAKLRGIDFRALGQEPGWYLEITHGKQIKYIGNYGKDTLFTPVPEPEVQSGKKVYKAETEVHSLTVEISDEPCTDSMSGFKFPSTVAVTVDGKSYTGCGRKLN